MAKQEPDISALFWETVLSIADRRRWNNASEISRNIGFAYARVYDAVEARAHRATYPGIQTAKWQQTLDHLEMSFWDFICHHPDAPMGEELGVPASIQSRMAASLDAKEMDLLITFAEIAVARGTFKDLLGGLIGTLRESR